ncbi:unnamed protein product, partial [Mesorhabditis spiculigera]
MTRAVSWEDDFQLQFGNALEQTLLGASFISISADTLVYLFLRIAKQHQPTNNNQKVSAELRLSILAFTTHLVQIIPTITLQPYIFTTFRWVLSHYVTIYNYHWNTVQGS